MDKELLKTSIKGACIIFLTIFIIIAVPLSIGLYLTEEFNFNPVYTALFMVVPIALLVFFVGVVDMIYWNLDLNKRMKR